MPSPANYEKGAIMSGRKVKMRGELRAPRGIRVQFYKDEVYISYIRLGYVYIVPKDKMLKSPEASVRKWFGMTRNTKKR